MNYFRVTRTLGAQAGLFNRTWAHTANLRTKVLDFGGFDSSVLLTVKGGLPRPIGIPGCFESSNLSRDNLSREIGRNIRASGRGGGRGSSYSYLRTWTLSWRFNK